MARAAASASWTVASALQHWRKEHRDTGRSRHKFAQEFQPLCQLDREKIDPLRLGTRPSLTGSSPTTKAMGMVVVAALAVSAEAVPPVATMSATCLRTSSPPRAGIWSSRFSAPTVVDRDVLAFGIASVFQACRNPRRGLREHARRLGVEEPDHWHRRLLRPRRQRSRNMGLPPPCIRAENSNSGTRK